MGSKRFPIALLCVILYSLRADATNVRNRGPPSSTRMADISSSSSSPSDNLGISSSSERPIPSVLPATVEDQSSGVTPKVFSDPFMLVGEDNVLGPPRRRKVIRRTRRRRIKKLKSTTESSKSADVSLSIGGSSSSTSTSTESVKAGSRSTAIPIKLQVVPIDSDQSVTEDVSASLPIPSPRPSPESKLPDPIFKSGHYTRHQRGRKKATPKANLWKTPNFSMELFDTDATIEDHNNVDKRESTSKNKTSDKYNMFTSKPTSLSFIPDMSTDESTNPYVNTSLPISTELQNSLQFTLQVLHPLLNSDSVLSENEPKIPEDKTVAVTHSLSSTVAETPIAPDLRFLPTHLRKSHPLLSDDNLFNSDSASKTGPRVRVHGMHSIRNPIISSTTSTTENSFRNKGRFKTTSSSTTTSTTAKGTNVPTITSTSTERTRIHFTPATLRTSTFPTSKQTASPTPFSSSTGGNLGPLGNLKITELVYPTVAQKSPGSSPGTIKFSSEESPDSSSTITASTASSTRPVPVYDNQDGRSPPLILMGSDSSVSELGIQSKDTMEGPPAFDDLLLEELVKGFVPPTTTTQSTTIKTTPTTAPTSTSTSTTSTTTTTTTTTTTSTTPRPKPTITTTRITTAEPPKVQDDETSQLLQLLNLLQSQQLPQTTEAIQSTSPVIVPGVGKLDDELLKNLALLDNILSPTAKTMLKEAVDAGTTEKIKAAKNPNGSGEGLSDADLKAIYMLLDAMSSTTEKPTTTTTSKPTMHPALQGMLTMLNNPWSEVQKMRAQQAGQPSSQATFSVPQPPKPVPTTSSLDLLSQLFNLNPQKAQQPKANQNPDLGLGSLLGSLIPKRQPTNREAASGSNQLLNFFQPDQPLSTPPPGPYYWFDMNAFLGNDPNSGAMSGFRPKMGTRDYFLKVRRRRDSMERYY